MKLFMPYQATPRCVIASLWDFRLKSWGVLMVMNAVVV